MKVNECYIDAINADKVLDVLKTSLEPEDNPRLTLTKIRSPYNVAYKIDYTAYVSKKEYKQIKEIATNLPYPENEEASSDESNAENNEEEENEMAEILRKFCEFQKLKEIRIPSDDIPVEDGVKRVVIKLKD